MHVLAHVDVDGDGDVDGHGHGDLGGPEKECGMKLFS